MELRFWVSMHDLLVPSQPSGPNEFTGAFARRANLGRRAASTASSWLGDTRTMTRMAHLRGATEKRGGLGQGEGDRACQEGEGGARGPIRICRAGLRPRRPESASLRKEEEEEEGIPLHCSSADCTGAAEEAGTG